MSKMRTAHARRGRASAHHHTTPPSPWDFSDLGTKILIVVIAVLASLLAGELVIFLVRVLTEFGIFLFHTVRELYREPMERASGIELPRVIIHLIFVPTALVVTALVVFSSSHRRETPEEAEEEQEREEPRYFPRKNRHASPAAQFWYHIRAYASILPSRGETLGQFVWRKVSLILVAVLIAIFVVELMCAWLNPNWVLLHFLSIPITIAVAALFHLRLVAIPDPGGKRRLSDAEARPSKRYAAMVFALGLAFALCVVGFRMVTVGQGYWIAGILLIPTVLGFCYAALYGSTTVAVRRPPTKPERKRRRKRKRERRKALYKRLGLWEFVLRRRQAKESRLAKKRARRKARRNR